MQKIKLWIWVMLTCRIGNWHAKERLEYYVHKDISSDSISILLNSLTLNISLYFLHISKKIYSTTASTHNKFPLTLLYIGYFVQLPAREGDILCPLLYFGGGNRFGVWCAGGYFCRRPASIENFLRRLASVLIMAFAVSKPHFLASSVHRATFPRVSRP